MSKLLKKLPSKPLFHWFEVGYPFCILFVNMAVDDVADACTPNEPVTCRSPVVFCDEPVATNIPPVPPPPPPLPAAKDADLNPHHKLLYYQKYLDHLNLYFHLKIKVLLRLNLQKLEYLSFVVLNLLLQLQLHYL